MRQSLNRCRTDERGATAIEYAMMAVMISIAIIAGASSIGTKLSAMHFGPLQNAFN